MGMCKVAPPRGVAPITVTVSMSMCKEALGRSLFGLSAVKMTAPSEQVRCQCRSLDCRGWASQRREASPKQCARENGGDCPFHSAAPPKKRGKHSKASRRGFFVSQDRDSYTTILQLCHLLFPPEFLLKRTDGGNVRWFARELMRRAQLSADEQGHREDTPAASNVSGVASADAPSARARPDVSGHGEELGGEPDLNPGAEQQQDIEDVANSAATFRASSHLSARRRKLISHASVIHAISVVQQANNRQVVLKAAIICKCLHCLYLICFCLACILHVM